MKFKPNTICFCVLATLSLPGCQGRRETPKMANSPVNPVPRETARPIQFTDVTETAGLKFVHNNAAFGLKFLPETMGSGVAFIDYDGDGYQDIFLVNGRDWSEAEIAAYRSRKWTQEEIVRRRRVQPRGPLVRVIPPRGPRRRTTSSLYYNNGDGTFTDVTKDSGLDREMFGMGAAVGDYDNDGRADLYVTGYGTNYLFRNLGQGRFRDVAAQMGVRTSHFSTSAAWVDYDKDGRLDLFVCEYVRWTPLNDVYATSDGIHKAYTRPTNYAGLFQRLYHNDGKRFTDVSAPAGIQQSEAPGGKNSLLPGSGLGVAVCDYNKDSWPDIIVANDLRPNFLFRNNKNGTFSEVAARSGIAYGPLGKPRAGMGIDAADIDHSGRESVVIGNFSGEMMGLFYNQGNGLFTDIVPHSNMAEASFYYLTFGCVFMDMDNDTWLDIFIANGHINPEADYEGMGTTYAQRPLLFYNKGGEAGASPNQPPVFEEIGLQSGEALQRRLVGRGLATADIDLDGDVDVIISGNGHGPSLLRNDGGHRNHALRLVLRGTRSNRSAIGAVVTAKTGKESLRHTVKSGSSYLSQSELPLTIGLGRHQQCEELLIRWPSGQETRLRGVTANQMVVVNEARGIVRRQPLRQRHAAQ